MKRFITLSLIVLAAAAFVAFPLGASVLQNAGLNDAEKARIVAELDTIDEREAQSVCPLTGAPVAEGQGYAYLGYFIGTCCGNCASKVEENPLSAIKALRDKGQEPPFVEGVTTQATCPTMTASAINDEVFSVKDNLLARFCCPGCDGGFNASPKTTAEKMIENGQAFILLTLDQTSCPISGADVNPEITVAIDGKSVALCCEGCAAPVQENGEAIVKALADRGVFLPSVES